MNRWIIGLLALWPAAALGQTGFYDHFEGNALLPHWEVYPSPRALEYNISNSLLHITGLPSPSNPKFSSNNGGIEAQFNPVSGDFYALARMGWDAGELRFMAVSVLGPRRELIASFAYRDTEILVRNGATPWIGFPAPPPGMHDFTIRRVGADIHFSLNGTPLTTLPAVFAGPATRVDLFFGVRYPNPGLAPMHVDLVQVVPTPAIPGTLVVFALSLVATRRR